MTKSSKLKVVYRKPSDLMAYPNNARTHSEDQIELVADSIKRFGFTNPVLLNGKSGILAGHGRVEAAILLGLVEVPTIDLGHLSKTDQRAYVLADNKLAEQAGWDRGLLKLELGELKGAGFELTALGFQLHELDNLLGPDEASDEVPDVPPVPVSRPGDLWCLGAHRLYCGDSSDPDGVSRALGVAQPVLMVTDPPYGVNYDPDWRNQADRKDGKKIGARAIGKVKNDNVADWRTAWALFPGDVAYVWYVGIKESVVAGSLEACGFQNRCQIIWVKDNIVIGRGNYHPKHECLLYAVRNKAHWTGGRKQNTVWEIKKNMKSETGHSTQKPVEAMRRPMVNNSSEGDFVYDPFMGSGTSLIAAELIGRRSIGIEIDPAYVDVAVLRWQQHTGEEAILMDARHRHGISWSKVAAERLKTNGKGKTKAKAKGKGKGKAKTRTGKAKV